MRWNRDIWLVRVDLRSAGIGLGYFLHKLVVIRVIDYDFVRRVKEICHAPAPVTKGDQAKRHSSQRVRRGTRDGGVDPGKPSMSVSPVTHLKCCRGEVLAH